MVVRKGMRRARRKQVVKKEKELGNYRPFATYLVLLIYPFLVKVLHPCDRARAVINLPQRLAACSIIVPSSSDAHKECVSCLCGETDSTVESTPAQTTNGR